MTWLPEWANHSAWWGGWLPAVIFVVPLLVLLVVDDWLVWRRGR